jgi:hypothetical protein
VTRLPSSVMTVAMRFSSLVLITVPTNACGDSAGDPAHDAFAAGGMTSTATVIVPTTSISRESRWFTEVSFTRIGRIWARNGSSHRGLEPPPVASAYRPAHDLQTLPRHFWVVDLDGPGGQGSIAARLDDLALLAAVAGWPPPPELTRLAR